jgi:hypothetical protein
VVLLASVVASDAPIEAALKPVKLFNGIHEWTLQDQRRLAVQGVYLRASRRAIRRKRLSFCRNSAGKFAALTKLVAAFCVREVVHPKLPGGMADAGTQEW